MASIQDLMNYIANMEGFNTSGTLADRNNNPGNLKYVGQAGAIGQDSRGFAIFDSVESGWNALQRQIQLDASRGLTLREFTYKYAPPSENNTTNYLSYLTGNLGLSADTPLASLNVIQNGNLFANSGDNSGSPNSILTDIFNPEGDTLVSIAVGLGVIGVVALLRG